MFSNWAFFFYIYGCRPGFWYEILAKGLLVCRFLLYSHIITYVFMFCEILSASDWLVDLRALRCSTTERKTRATFLLLCDFGHSRDSFVPVAFCISARTDFLVFFFLWFLFPIQKSTAVFVLLRLLYIFPQRYYYPFYFLCFILYPFVWCI